MLHLAWLCIFASILCLFIRCIVVLLRCRPIHYNWQEPFENPKHCYSLKPTIIALAGFGLIIDGVTWIMPHWVVWKLQLRPAHKLAITSIFALGILCDHLDCTCATDFFANSACSNIVIGISRITALADLSFTDDITYYAVPAII